MTIQQHVSLLPYNTFGIDVQAEYFVAVATLAELKAALRLGIQPVMVLGGGSNVLLTRNVPGLVIKNNIQEIKVVRSFNHKVWVEVGGGVGWHDFVQWAVQHNLGGVENMSLIPGTVGAAPVQNIGAYGVELKDVFVRLRAVALATGKERSFSHAECQFGYRDSIFKKDAKGKYCITSVVFSLSRHQHKLNISYGDIRKTLETNGVTQPSIADVSKAVVDIRSSKLPDPARIGNSGSFFKNPETSRAVLERLQKTHPQAPFYDLPNGRVKIPAGWLIEQCGWKGKRVGNTGSYEKQALVLVNYGGATGAEVKNLAEAIIQSVKTQFDIDLEAEVNMI
jgi:UDP-N-acetylmuramate dehydrogenase